MSTTCINISPNSIHLIVFTNNGCWLAHVLAKTRCIFLSRRQARFFMNWDFHTLGPQMFCYPVNDLRSRRRVREVRVIEGRAILEASTRRSGAAQSPLQTFKMNFHSLRKCIWIIIYLFSRQYNFDRGHAFFGWETLWEYWRDKTSAKYYWFFRLTLWDLFASIRILLFS